MQASIVLVGFNAKNTASLLLLLWFLLFLDDTARSTTSLAFQPQRPSVNKSTIHRGGCRHRQQHPSTASHCQKFPVGVVQRAAETARDGGGADPEPQSSSPPSSSSPSAAGGGGGGGGGGTASIPNLTVSLVKSIVGSGVLALPAAVAKLGDTPPQVLPAACVLIAGAGATYAYFFRLVGQVCDWTGAATFRQAWDETVGGTGWSGQAVAAAVVIKTAQACVAYSMILADASLSLAVAAGLDRDVTRTEALIAVTVTALLPLCLKKDLTSLGPFSAVALLSFAVTVGTVVARALDGSYAVVVAAADAAAVPVDAAAAAAAAAVESSSSLLLSSSSSSSSYLADLPDHLQPSFGDSVSYVPDPRGVVLLCTLATAFVAHYNAPRFYRELRAPRTVDRFGRVVTVSYAVAAAVFVIVSAAGFATFGTSSQPMILNSFSPRDPLASACRAFLAGSILLTFPLPFVGLRDGVLDVGGVPPEERTDKLVSAVSVALLAVVTAVAVNVRDLGIVLSIGGGTFSTAVAAVFPTAMFCAAVKKRRERVENGEDVTIDPDTLRRNDRQAQLALFLASISVAVGFTGVSIELNRVFHWL